MRKYEKAQIRPKCSHLVLLLSRVKMLYYFPFQGSLCSPLKSGGFFGTFVCTGKGCVGRRARLRTRFAHLSKVVVKTGGRGGGCSGGACGK